MGGTAGACAETRKEGVLEVCCVGVFRFWAPFVEGLGRRPAEAHSPGSSGSPGAVASGMPGPGSALPFRPVSHSLSLPSPSPSLPPSSTTLAPPLLSLTTLPHVSPPRLSPTSPPHRWYPSTTSCAERCVPACTHGTSHKPTPRRANPPLPDSSRRCAVGPPGQTAFPPHPGAPTPLCPTPPAGLLGRRRLSGRFYHPALERHARVQLLRRRGRC